jgi:hypothetical protein
MIQTLARVKQKVASGFSFKPQDMSLAACGSQLLRRAWGKAEGMPAAGSQESGI